MEYFTHSVSDDDEFDLPEIAGNPSANNDVEDIDFYLNRPRSYGFRRNKPLEEAPEFVKRLNAFEEVPAGCTVVFECQWKAFPKPTVKWYKDDEAIPADDERHQTQSDDKGVERLIMLKGAKKDEGAYKCKVENQEGVASTTGYLSISGDIEEKTLASKSRGKQSEHSVSSAPLLRSIKEQRSLEEREWEEARNLSPSPLHEFINNFRRETTEAQMAQLGYANIIDPVAQLSAASSVENVSEIEGDSTSISSDTSVDSQDFERVGNEPETPPIEKIPTYPNGNADMLDGEDTDKEDDVIGNQTKYSISDNQTDSEKLENIKNKREISPVSIERTTVSGVFASTRPMIIDPNRLRENTQDVITKQRQSETMASPYCEEPEISQPHEDDNIPMRLSRHRRSLTPATQRLIDEMPENMSRMLGEQLQMPWIYYFAFSSCCASYAAATELNPIYLILFVGIVSLISFHYITGTKDVKD